MNAPQIIAIIVLIIDFGIAMARHGEERSPYNGGITFLASVTWLGLLIWGGFFK